jgi:hypothetical protein
MANAASTSTHYIEWCNILHFARSAGSEMRTFRNRGGRHLTHSRTGLGAGTNALMNLSCTFGAIASASMPAVPRNSRAPSYVVHAGLFAHRRLCRSAATSLGATTKWICGGGERSLRSEFACMQSGSAASFCTLCETEQSQGLKNAGRTS